MKRKSVVIQGIKDRSRIREHMVTRKQGCGDEGESREGKLGEDPEMGDHGKKRRSGKIQGRSIDLWGLVFRSVRGEGNEGKRTRMKS